MNFHPTQHNLMFFKDLGYFFGSLSTSRLIGEALADNSLQQLVDALDRSLQCAVQVHRTGARIFCWPLSTARQHCARRIPYYLPRHSGAARAAFRTRMRTGASHPRWRNRAGRTFGGSNVGFFDWPVA
jgi:hypothetical protein